MNKIELLKALIAKETDEKELERLNKELIAAIREDEREKLKKEMEEKQAADEKVAKEKQDAEEKSQKMERSKATGMYVPVSRIEVVSPDRYKGFSLRKAADVAIAAFADSPSMKSLVPYVKERPERFEGVLKHFTDLYADAIQNPVKAKAMQEGDTAEGGYITPTEERMELLAYIRETSVALQDARHIPMTSDSLTLPRELTQVSVAFTAEETAATETTPTVDQVTLTAKRLDAYTISSNELIQDTGVPGGIVGMLLSQFVEAVGQKIDSATFLCGGNPVSSVFSAQAGYSQVFGTGSAHFSMLLETDLRSIIAKIPTSRLGNAKWYVHRSPAWTYLYGLKDGSNRLLFIPSMNQANPHQLYGYPVRMPEQAPGTSAASTGFILFGDLKGFWIGDRLTNISLFVDPYSKSREYQTVFLMFTRWAFAHALPNYYGRIVTAAS